MTSCAATTTIREALTLNGYPDEDTQPCPVDALASLDQLVEAAQVVYREFHAGCEYAEEKDLRAALAAVGPGQEKK